MVCKQKTIDNHLQYIVIIILSMIYMSIMLCNAILTNLYIGTKELFVLGGTFTSPFIFVLDDIIAEIYGYKVIKSIIITAFLAQTLFIIICQFAILAPHPTFFHNESAYFVVIGSPLVRIGISGFIAYIIANIANSYMITRWKILLKGKYFWIRSLGSSIVSEALYSFIAIAMMELSSIPIKSILKISSLSFAIKAIYSVILSWPATILVTKLKKITGIDEYEFPQQFTLFHYLNHNTKEI